MLDYLDLSNYREAAPDELVVGEYLHVTSGSSNGVQGSCAVKVSTDRPFQPGKLTGENVQSKIYVPVLQNVSEGDILVFDLDYGTGLDTFVAVSHPHEKWTVTRADGINCSMRGERELVNMLRRARNVRKLGNVSQGS